MGLLDGIGQLLDPAGIFSSGGGEQGGLSKLFDPAGLFGMIKGEVDKGAHPDGANGNTDVKAGAAKVMDTYNGVKDLATQFKSDGSDGAAGADHSQTPTDGPPTEAPPHSDPAQDGAGYAPGPGAPQEQKDASTAEHTAAPVGEEPVIKQDAATANLSPEIKEELDALQTLSNYFSAYKRSNGFDDDGWADMNNLETVIAKGDQPAELVAAAKYVKEHPDVWRMLVAMSGSTNGQFSLDGIQDYLAKRVTDISQQRPPTGGPPPPPGGSPPPGGTPPPPPVGTPPGGSPTVDQHKPNYTQPVLGGGAPQTQPSSGFDANAYGSSVDRPGALKPATDFESAIANMDDRLHSMEDTMARLTDDMVKGTDPNASPADKAKSQAAEKLYNMLNLRYQALMSTRKQMYELLSNIHKTYDDMSMHAISNIR